MKKLLIILSVLNGICLALPAQINRMSVKPQQSRVVQQSQQQQSQQQFQQQPPQQQQSHQQFQQQPAQQQQGTTSRKPMQQMTNRSRVFPVPGKLNFMTLKKSLLKPGAAPRSFVANKTMYTNTHYLNQVEKRPMNNNANMNNVMSNRNMNVNATFQNQNARNKAASDNLSSNGFNRQLERMEVLYTVNKNFSDGHKASFTLTNNTDTWATDFGYVKKRKDSVADHSDPSWNCASITQSVNAQSSSFMNASVNQKGTSLVPGTIYAFDDYAKGNFREFTAGRNPVVVWTPTTVGKDSFNIQNPNGQTLSQGISNIVSQFSQTQGGASAYEHTIFSDNESDLNMLVSAGGSYSGFTGFGINKSNQGQHHIYVTYDAIKPLYTIIAQPPPEGYFADGKVPATSSPLVVVQNVTYGTRLLANIDIQTSTFTNYDSLHLAYTDGVDNGALDFSMLANNKSLTYTGNLMVVGTGINIPIISGQNYQQQISDLLAQGNYRTAMPIQYQLTDLDGNILGVESVTDQFTAPFCLPADEIFYLQSVKADITTGNDGKNGDSDFNLYIGNGTLSNWKTMGTYENNTTEIKHENGTISIPLNFPQNAPENSYTLDDFKNGGVIRATLQVMINHVFAATRDDWDINQLKVTFNFRSQKGTVKTFPVPITNFRMSDPDRPTADFYFDAGFNLN